jgi:predicted GNAT family N-acyltransferase
MQEEQRADYRLVPCRFGDALWERVVALRLRVYVDEQKVPLELELDEHDKAATHFALLQKDEVVATVRIVRAGDSAHIGRLAVDIAHRRKGLGRRLMLRALASAAEDGCTEAILDAQTWITHLYAQFGFEICSDKFMDAGIPHFRMRRSLKPPR